MRPTFDKERKTFLQHLHTFYLDSQGERENFSFLEEEGMQSARSTLIVSFVFASPVEAERPFSFGKRKDDQVPGAPEGSGGKWELCILSSLVGRGKRGTGLLATAEGLITSGGGERTAPVNF